MVKLNFFYTSYFKVSWVGPLKKSIIYSKNIAYFLSFMYILIGLKRNSIKIVTKPRRKKLISVVTTPQTSKRGAFQFSRIKYNNSVVLSLPINNLSVGGMVYLYSYIKKLSKIFLSILSFQTKFILKANVNLIYIK